MSVSIRADRLDRKSTKPTAKDDARPPSGGNSDESRAQRHATGNTCAERHVTACSGRRKRLDYDTDIIDGFLIASFDTIDDLQVDMRIIILLIHA